MGLFSSLGVGVKGLSSAQLQMEVAGQNISNADVEGYSRKRVNQTADYRYDTRFGQFGTGVEVVNIERYRDTYLDTQIQRQNESVGYWQEMDNTLERVENIFTEPSDSGILHFTDEFFNSWQNLVNNPADMSARTMVQTNGEILAEVFHNTSSELRDLQKTRNDEISLQVDQVNQYSKEIYNLNLEISASEVNNQNANDSRDRRDLLLKKLSNIIDIQTQENDAGQVTVTTMGNIIVSPVNMQKLEVTSKSFTRSDGTTQNDIAVQFKDSKHPYTPKSGKMAALFDSRDNVIPEYLSKLDDLAIAISESVNEKHKEGYNLMGYSGIEFWNSSLTGASDIELSEAIKGDVQNIAAASAGTSNKAITVSTAPGATNFGAPPIQLTRNAGVPYNSAIHPTTERARNIVAGSVTVTTASGTVLTEGTDYHVDYSIGTIQTLHTGYDGQALNIDFEYRTGQFNGPGDNSNAVEIAGLRNDLTMNKNDVGEYTSTYDEFYSSYIGDLGLARNEAKATYETRKTLIAQYESKQEAIAGVSIDEEMADLIKFQHTYQAAARIISTADEMLNTLLNM